MQQETDNFQLPLGIVSKVDVGRLLREIDALNTYMRSAETRQAGASVRPPKTSKLFDEFMELNQKSALKNEDREQVTGYLKYLRKEAPTIHMSFSADPSPLFTKRLVRWLRQNIHPSLLLQVGLQPTIGAGAIVRTTNKYFDFSLREFFNKNKMVLIRKLDESKTGTSASDNAQPRSQKAEAGNNSGQNDRPQQAVSRTAPAQESAAPQQQTPQPNEERATSGAQSAVSTTDEQQTQSPKREHAQ